MRNNFTLKVNGSTIHYNDAGTSDMPLVFIHGFPFDRTSWLEQYNFFKSKRRVIIYDIRGFGESVGDSDTQFSMEVFAKDLILFLEALKIDKAIVCGLSMGGYILMNALKMAPEKFAAIILADTQCNDDSAEAKQKRYKTIETIQAKGTTEFAENFLKTIFYESSYKENKETVEFINEIVLNTAQQTIISALQALAERDETCSVLENVAIPTLIICGKQDVVTPPEKSEAMHKMVKNSKYVLIDKAGHLSNIDDPEAFNQHLNDFIESL